MRSPRHRISLDPDQLATVMDTLMDAAKDADPDAHRASNRPLDLVAIRRQGAAHRLRSVYDDIKEQINQPQCTCNPQHRGYCDLAEDGEDDEDDAGEPSADADTPSAAAAQLAEVP